MVDFDALKGKAEELLNEHGDKIEDGVEKRVLNGEATEAAKEKLAWIKESFTSWIWTDPFSSNPAAGVTLRPDL